MKMAEEAELDLVVISPNQAPPVAKILNYGKYKYEPQEQQKKALLKLTGLFEDDINNLYTYNRAKNKFGIPER